MTRLRAGRRIRQLAGRWHLRRGRARFLF